jgi:glutamine synthetase adenylyltransferase
MDSARILAQRMHSKWEGKTKPLANLILSLAGKSLNPHRALLQVFRVSASLAKTEQRFVITETNLETLLQLCGVSDPFAERIAAQPALVASLGTSVTTALRRDYRAILRTAIDAERSFPAELAALRLQWSELIVEIAALDVANELSIFETNSLQTELATASMNVAYLIARREMARRYGSFSGGPRVAFYGRLRLRPRHPHHLRLTCAFSHQDLDAGRNLLAPRGTDDRRSCEYHSGRISVPRGHAFAATRKKRTAGQ